MKIAKSSQLLSTQGASLLVRVFFIVVAGLCLSTNVAVAQVFSTEGNPYYQKIRFQKGNPGSYLQDNGVGYDLAGTITGSDTNNQLWALIGSPQKFYLKSKLNNYFYYPGNTNAQTSATEKSYFTLQKNGDSWRFLGNPAPNDNTNAHVTINNSNDNIGYNDGGNRQNITFIDTDAVPVSNDWGNLFSTEDNEVWNFIKFPDNTFFWQVNSGDYANHDGNVPTTTEVGDALNRYLWMFEGTAESFTIKNKNNRKYVYIGEGTTPETSKRLKLNGTKQSFFRLTKIDGKTYIQIVKDGDNADYDNIAYGALSPDNAGEIKLIAYTTEWNADAAVEIFPDISNVANLTKQYWLRFSNNGQTQNHYITNNGVDNQVTADCNTLSTATRWKMERSANGAFRVKSVTTQTGPYLRYDGTKYTMGYQNNATDFVLYRDNTGAYSLRQTGDTQYAANLNTGGDNAGLSVAKYNLGDQNNRLSFIPYDLSVLPIAGNEYRLKFPGGYLDGTWTVENVDAMAGVFKLKNGGTYLDGGAELVVYPDAEGYLHLMRLSNRKVLQQDGSWTDADNMAADNVFTIESTTEYPYLIRFVDGTMSQNFVTYNGSSENVQTSTGTSVASHWRLLPVAGSTGFYIENESGDRLAWTGNNTTGRYYATREENQYRVFDFYTSPDGKTQLRRKLTANGSAMCLAGQEVTEQGFNNINTSLELVCRIPQEGEWYRIVFTQGRDKTNGVVTNNHLSDLGNGSTGAAGNSVLCADLLWQVKYVNATDHSLGFRLVSVEGRRLLGDGTTADTADGGSTFTFEADNNIDTYRLKSGTDYLHLPNQAGDEYRNLNLIRDPYQTAGIEMGHKASFLKDQTGAASYTGAEFQKGTWMTTPAGYAHAVQNVNTYSSTRYVKPGEWVEVYLPTYLMNNTNDHKMYQRLYALDNGEKNIDRNHVKVNTLTGHVYKDGFVTGVMMPRHLQRNAEGIVNGFVNGGGADRGSPHFIFNTFQAQLLAEEDSYTVVLDESRYSDYETDANGQVTKEPSLTMRCRWTLKPATEIAAVINNLSTGQFYEEHTIHFPTKSPNFTTEKVPLDMELLNYWFGEGTTLTNAGASPDNIEVELKTGGTTGIALVAQGTGGADDVAGLFTFKENNATKIFAKSHFITFQYPAAGTDGWAVAQPGTEEIYVYGKIGEIRYRIAKFTLVFEPNSETLAYTDILGDNATEKGKARSHGGMTDDKKLIASVSFDYPMNTSLTTPDVTAGGGWTAHGKRMWNAQLTYPDNAAMPLNFEICDYAFDGGVPAAANVRYANNDVINTGTTQQGTQGPDWGGYMIASKYAKEGATYYPINDARYGGGTTTLPVADGMQAGFFHVDASELPGKVCSLPFDGNFCANTMLYVTGWMGNIITINDNTRQPGSVLLTIVGIDDSGEHELYTFCPGQLPYEARREDGTVVGSHTATNGQETAVWQQFYCQFLTKTQYASYELRIVNNCVSSAGGDFLLDNISVYSRTPNIEMDKNTPLCGGTSHVMKMSTEWETLKSVLGINEEPESESVTLHFAFMDMDAFIDKFMEVSNVTESKEEVRQKLANGDYANHSEYNTAFSSALKASILAKRDDKGDITLEEHLAGSTTDGNTDAPFTKYTFTVKKGELTEKEVPTFTWESALTGSSYVFKETRDQVDYLVFNANGAGHTWDWDRDYYILMLPSLTISEGTDFENFDIQDNCTTRGMFRLESPVVLITDEGPADGNSKEVCAGQSYNLTTAIETFIYSGTDTGDKGSITDLNFDWYIGSLDEFHTAKWPDDDDGVLLHDALSNFRAVDAYKSKTNLTGVTPLVSTFTQDMINCLQHFIDTGKLQLHQKIVNVQHIDKVSDTDEYFYIVACPVTDDEAWTAVVPSINKTSTGTGNNVIYCAEPQELRLHVKGNAPKAKSAFANGVGGIATYNYGDFMTSADNVSVRISKNQFDKIRQTSVKGTAAYEAETYPVLHLPLRGVTVQSDGALGVTVNDRNVYLQATNDKTMRTTLEQKVVAGDRLIVAKISQLTGVDATKDQTGDFMGRTEAKDNTLQIYFTQEFDAREGHWYRLKVPFREEGGTETSCDGDLMVDIIIVPDYEVWTGKADNTEWNNDLNWARADYDELKAENGTTLNKDNGTVRKYETNSDVYTGDDDEEVGRGFAPLYVTHILMANEKKTAFSDTPASDARVAFNDGFPSLYDVSRTAGDITAGDVFPNLQTTASPILKYDLIVRDWTQEKHDATSPELDAHGVSGDLISQMYVANVCDEIAFQPRTELLNAHYLTYNKAWVEYEMKKNDWHLLSSPLQGMISGEWYAPTGTARQETTYFEPVVFNTTNYDRYSPAVYQRGWDKAKAVLYEPGATWSNDDGVQRDEGSTMPGSWMETQTGSSVYNWEIEGGENADEYLQRITYKPFGQNKANVAIKGTWSNVFNDHSVKYDNGGFSVMVINDLKGETDEDAAKTAIFRLPKEDTFYDIWKWDKNSDDGLRTRVNIAETASANNPANTLVVPNRGKLRSNGMTATSDLTVTLSNEGGGSLGYFLCGNPFVCGLDMDKFFAANTGLARSYRQYDNTGNLQTITVDEGSSHIVEPGQAFFIEQSTSEGSTPAGSVTLTFTTAMMTAAYPLPGTTSAPAPSYMTITAERGQRKSTAVVKRSGNASNMFVENEDVETFIDENSIACPTVYTLCGRLATTVNRLNDFRVLPVGIESDSDDDCMLTFNGVEALGDSISLYDAVEETLTPLTEGYQVSAPGRTYGRYYIVKGLSLREAANESRLQIYAEGSRVTVVSMTGEPIRNVRCVDVAGHLLYSAAPQSATHSFDLSAKGVCIIDAQTKDCRMTKKMIVKH